MGYSCGELKSCRGASTYSRGGSRGRVCTTTTVFLRTGEDGEVDLVLDVVHDRLSLLGRAALALFRFVRKSKQQQKEQQKRHN